jgi:uncharacterized protein (TIGR01777 family)
MHILVTGGTGFVGQHLVAALLARGDSVAVVSRELQKSPLAAGARLIGWERCELETEKAHAVVHLAGAGVAEARWTKARLALLRSSRIGPTEALARVMAKNPRGARVLVSASAVGFYGMRRDNDFLDEAAPSGNDVLADLCVAWESAASPARDAGIRVVHPRFGMVLGKGGGALEKMSPPFRAYLGGPLGDGTQWISWVHLDDVVRSLLFALDTSTAEGPVNVTAPEPVTMNHFARALGHALGRPSSFRVPSFALKMAMGDMAQMLLTGQRVLPKKLLESAFSFEWPTLEGALDDIVGA